VPFSAPKIDAFRRFVVLDSPAILAALSALDGGAVDEILTRRSGDSGNELGGEVGIEPVKVRGKRGKSQRIEEEMRRVRTEHSSASALIDRLHERDAVGILDGVLDDEALHAMSPGMVVQLEGAVSLHPVFQIDAVLASFIKNAPTLGQAEQAKELRQVVPLMRMLMGTGDQDGRILLDIDTGSSQVARIIAFAERSAIQVPIEDLTGRFSALVQIDEILQEPGEELLTLRAIRGARPGQIERDAIMEGALALIEPAKELGVPLAQDDLIMPAPLVLLRPIAIWR
jgi:hypothetical protein